MNARTFLNSLKQQTFYSDQPVHVEDLPERHPAYGEVKGGILPAIQSFLAEGGIDRLYCHQADAINLIRTGENVVVVTGTASGKTLCYNIPVVEALAQDPLATVLYIFPTKALAQDQLRSINGFQDVEEVTFLAGTYDGDTPQNLRRKLRDGGNVILTNPDMLHQGVLPHHARWNRFFTHLKYVVIDEVHAYRGVFGSHLANVLRRLGRVCRHYGSSPQFICCSATINNPREHAQNITGQDMALVTNDGSPRGPKRFVLWNPPALETAAKGSSSHWRTGGDRKSPIWEAIHLMTTLVKGGVQTITFVRTRLAAELIFKNCRDLLAPVSRKLAGAIHAYRGGYLPEERRRIEQQLVNREILGVASTNALELGIDIGSLEACILVGYPAAIASLWQQAGRAGRGQEESIVFLIGQNTPIDQFLMAHSGYIFKQNPEQAVIDPDNPHIVVGHLQCALHELPLTDSDVTLFGPYAEVVLELLEEDETIRHIDEHWYWASSAYPAAEVNLRNIAGPVYTIQDEVEGERVIGTLDELSALAQLHTHAVYLHGADTYFVNKLDTEQKIAHVERRDLDYYTQSIQSSQIQIDEKESEEEAPTGLIGFGEVTVTTTIPMFKKIRFHSRDSLGFEKLEMPPQLLETVSMWYAPPPESVEAMLQWLKDRRTASHGQSRHGNPANPEMIVGDALIGIANVLVEVAPLFVMSDPSDIGAVVDSNCLGRDALFVHDRYPGGMGYARRVLDHFDEMLKTLYTVIRECACEDGCPSCVGAALPAFAMTDLDSSARGRIPDKAAATFLLEYVIKE